MRTLSEKIIKNHLVSGEMSAGQSMYVWPEVLSQRILIWI